MDDPDILLSWKEMMKPCWGLLPPSFPAVSREFDEEDNGGESCRKTQLEQNNKFFAAQRTETPEEREDRLNRELREELLQKYASVFVEKLGEEDRLADVEVNLELKEDAEIKPKFYSSARVTPRHYQEPSKELVGDLLAAGVLEEVHHNTEWCCKGHFVGKKDGKVRLVVDLRPVNQAIKRPVKPFTSTDQIRRQLDPKGKVYCTMDMVAGYHQVAIAEESRDLTTFIIPAGRFRFASLPMGLVSSGDYFNIETDDVVEGITGTHKSLDDVLGEGVGATTDEARADLKRKLDTILSRMAAKNIKLNPKKFHIGKEVNFGGFRVGYNMVTDRPEILPDKAKVAAMEAIKRPATKKEAESIIGSLKQLTTWSKDTTVNTEQMRKLIRKDEHFQWTPKHDEEWTKVKRMLKNLSRVTPFQMGEETEIYCDASRVGISYVLVQRRNGEKLIMMNIICLLINLVMIICKRTERTDNTNLRREQTQS